MLSLVTSWSVSPESAFVVPLPAHTCSLQLLSLGSKGAGGSKRLTANDDNTQLDPREWVESCVECNRIQSIGLEVMAGHWLLWLVTEQTQRLLQTGLFGFKDKEMDLKYLLLWNRVHDTAVTIWNTYCYEVKCSLRSCHHLMQLNGMLVFPFWDSWCNTYLVCGEQVTHVLNVTSSSTSGMSAVTQARHRLSHTHTTSSAGQQGQAGLLYLYKQVHEVTTSWLVLVIRLNVWSQKMTCWCAWLSKSNHSTAACLMMFDFEVYCAIT